MARVYKRGDVWYCYGWDANGGRWKESTRQHDKRAAERVAVEIERRRAHAPAQEKGKPLLEALNALLVHAQRANRSAATMMIYAEKGRHLRGFFGDRFNLLSLTAEKIVAYADHRLSQPKSQRPDAKNISRGTVHKELIVLRRACTVAGVEWRKGFTPDIGKVYTPRKRWLTKDVEYPALLRVLSQEHQDYVVMWCNTGVRASELYKIQIEDVDLKAKTLRVRGTKTERSERILSLPKDARDVLMRRRTREPMFPRWKNVNRGLPAACKRAGIEPASPNDFRRTLASWLIQAGVEPMTVAKTLGHASLKMVMQVYAQLGMDVQQRVMEHVPSGYTCGTDTVDIVDAMDGNPERVKGG